MEETAQMPLTGTQPQETAGAIVPSPEEFPPAGEDQGEPTAFPSGDTTPRQAQPEDRITYRFNHETKTVSREEAPAMIQRLLKAQREAEKSAPLLDKLRFLAETGGSTPEQLLASWEEEYEKKEYDRLLQYAGGDPEIAGRLLEMSKKERRENFKTTAALREEQEREEQLDTTRRMGEELAELRDEFPGIREFKDLPEGVVKEALEKDLSLTDSYLRYLHRNARRAESERERQKRAAAASAGSLRGEPEQREKVDAQVSAFIAAFRNEF